VSPGESYDAAAARELAEELGLQGKLSRVAEVAACPQTGWEHVVLFQCRTTVEPVPNPAEITKGAFFTLAEIDRMLVDPSLPITPSFRLIYSLWEKGEIG
jgi:isopentenyldiphosphate isomerase